MGFDSIPFLLYANLIRFFLSFSESNRKSFLCGLFKTLPFIQIDTLYSYNPLPQNAWLTLLNWCFQSIQLDSCRMSTFVQFLSAQRFKQKLSNFANKTWSCLLQTINLLDFLILGDNPAAMYHEHRGNAHCMHATKYHAEMLALMYVITYGIDYIRRTWAHNVNSPLHIGKYIHWNVLFGISSIKKLMKKFIVFLSTQGP